MPCHNEYMCICAPSAVAFAGKPGQNQFVLTDMSRSESGRGAGISLLNIAKEAFRLPKLTCPRRLAPDWFAPHGAGVEGLGYRPSGDENQLSWASIGDQNAFWTVRVPSTLVSVARIPLNALNQFRPTLTSTAPSLSLAPSLAQYMTTTLPYRIFPQIDDSGTPLDRQTRHYVVGYQSRLVGAIRLRQVRMDPVPCPAYIPNWAVTVEVGCCCRRRLFFAPALAIF